MFCNARVLCTAAAARPAFAVGTAPMHNHANPGAELPFLCLQMTAAAPLAVLLAVLALMQPLSSTAAISSMHLSDNAVLDEAIAGELLRFAVHLTSPSLALGNRPSALYYQAVKVLKLPRVIARRSGSRAGHGLCAHGSATATEGCISPAVVAGEPQANEAQADKAQAYRTQAHEAQSPQTQANKAAADKAQFHKVAANKAADKAAHSRRGIAD